MSGKIQSVTELIPDVHFTSRRSKKGSEESPVPGTSKEKEENLDKGLDDRVRLRQKNRPRKRIWLYSCFQYQWQQGALILLKLAVSSSLSNFIPLS